MNYFGTLLLMCGVWFNLSAQNPDLSVLVDAPDKSIDKKGSGGIFGFYSNYLSNQILNDCIYDHSCSVFSKGAIKELGAIKGVFLTADRLMRCNRASHAEMDPVRFNKEGKITDHWNDYKKPD